MLKVSTEIFSIFFQTLMKILHFFCLFLHLLSRETSSCRLEILLAQVVEENLCIGESYPSFKRAADWGCWTKNKDALHCVLLANCMGTRHAFLIWRKCHALNTRRRGRCPWWTMEMISTALRWMRWAPSVECFQTSNHRKNTLLFIPCWLDQIRWSINIFNIHTEIIDLYVIYIINIF